MTRPSFVSTRRPRRRALPKRRVAHDDVSVVLTTNLPLHRQSLGYSQDTLAALVGIKPSLLGSYEEGRSQPPYPTLRRLAQEFGITTDQLLGTGCDG